MIFYLIQVSKIKAVTRIQAMLCMNVNRMKNCHIFRILFYLTAWRIQDLHFLV
jgi:hypothetical protein